MKYNKYIFRLFVVLLIALMSCKNERLTMPNPSGNAGDLLVVMNDSIKKSNVGQYIKNIVQQPMQGLPQEESLFKLLTAPHREFNGHMMTFRNIITVKINPKIEHDSISYHKNLWARDQSVIRIISPSKTQLHKFIENNEIKILGFFLAAERKRNISYFKSYLNTEIVMYLKENWDSYMAIPNTFKKNKSGVNFSWFSEEGPVHSLGLIIYSFDYVGEGTFSREYLLNKRDSILKINLPGPSDGSYMTTEHQLPVTYKTFSKNNQKAVELRGLWKVQGDIMGGPFISHIHLDTTTNKVIVTEGYVYSPEKPNKRNFMWQIDAILYTFKKLGPN